MDGWLNNQVHYTREIVSNGQVKRKENKCMIPRKVALVKTIAKKKKHTQINNHNKPKVKNDS